MESNPSTTSRTTNPARENEKKRSRNVYVYTGSIAAVGMVVGGYALFHLPENHGGMLLFAVMAVIAEIFSVELFQSSRGSHISVSSIIAIAGILVFGPLAGALTHMASGITTAFTTTAMQRQKPKNPATWFHRLVFNTGMWVIATAAAGYVYVFTGGTVGSIMRLPNILPLFLAALVDWLLNVSMLVVVIALQTGRNLIQVFRDDFSWTGPISVTGGVVGGGALALAFEIAGLIGVLVFFLPILATTYSYRLYTDNMRVYIDKLKGLNQELEDANLDLMETLSAVIDAYDAYTNGHSKQVAIYAQALAERLELPPSQRIDIVKAALLHDIGKIGIKDNIVSKPGNLTDEEYLMMKRHTVIGAEIVARVKGLKSLVPLVRHHHERWDGKGYPDGLAEERIPVGARIIALADSLDAMCSDRPYRKTRDFTEIVDEINCNSGKQFDPQVVRAFAGLVREKEPGFFKNSALAVDREVTLDGADPIDLGIRRFLKRSLLE